ncbi:acyltransferase 3 protein (plasmid) [Rhizobium etli bv. mimosae str. IE4771]|uniref:Acyltransferase 3 protein n=1 Tax=Rhizobium etli bv. mimosae str. IE4771 TaxID=1432050 RepID=A0A060III0_RHIET|nr:acyltransferase [Rhizobium sp. IE4771]AIC31396.1 acyltransferase 3 protein [Rhizobium sp. IE4771]
MLIGERFSNGYTTGFDYLRVVLAVAVLCIHSFAVSYGKAGEIFLFQPPLRGLVTFVLPAFFALSGFLVSASLLRTRNIARFLGLRALRLVPALAVEVALCALVLGPLFTTQPLASYFSDPQFSAYFLNIVGHIQYLLPGLFRDNPYYHAVNVSLWTIPYELECYIVLTVLAVMGLVYRPVLLIAVVLVAHGAVIGRDVLRGAAELPMDGALPGRILLLSFLAGVVLFICRDRLTVTPIRAVAAALVSFAMLNLPYAPYFASFPIAYVTVAIGLTKPSKHPLLASGDYSYGIYLYAFPVQQAVAHLLPQYREWYINIALALPATVLLAFFSWHAIEKHALKLKGLIVGKTGKARTAKPQIATSARVSVAGDGH